MKKTLFFFLALFTQLFSQELPSNQLPKFKNWWSWDKSFLYLNIELENGFQFSNSYNKLLGENGEIGVEIHCYPSTSTPFFGVNEEVLEIVFTVFLNYNLTDHFVNFKIDKKYIYKTQNWLISDTTTTISTFSGKISNVDIDLSILPTFSTDLKGNSKGYFTFTKLTE